MPKVSFLDECIDVECASGELLTEVAAKAGVDLFRGIWPELNCRRYGVCGRCKVWVNPRSEGAVTPKTFWERVRPKVVGTVRLACQLQVLGDIEVRTRPGRSAARPNLAWAPDPRHFRWQDRLNAKDEDQEDAAPKKAAPANKAAPAPAAATSAVRPAEAAPVAAPASPAPATPASPAATPATPAVPAVPAAKSE